jgi:hypothetical protein
MTDTLFKFPVILVDGQDQKKEDLMNLRMSEDMEYIVGEAEHNYYDFNGIMDMWLPKEESKEKAQEGIFDACIVSFAGIGQFMVPWTKKEFKKRLDSFVSTLEKQHAKEETKTIVRSLTKKQLKSLLDSMPDDE